MQKKSLAPASSHDAEGIVTSFLGEKQ